MKTICNNLNPKDKNYFLPALLLLLFYLLPLAAADAAPGDIVTVAGGYVGDGGVATSAALHKPNGIVVDGAGNIYISDVYNHRVRKVDASTGTITTVAGNGTAGYWGDGGPATSAGLSSPNSIVLDGSGNIYIADSYNNRIRKVTASTGIITTVAGNGTESYSGDGGSATSASMDYPLGIVLDRSGNIYISDSYNNRIRKVTASTGIITTIAGSGIYGYSGDGGTATSASLKYPNGVAVDRSGNIYISDSYNNRIRKVTASTGIITTVAGNGTGSYWGDGGPATSAGLVSPMGVAVDGAGNIYIADSYNHRIRKVTASTGIITTIAGTGYDLYWGDGGPATSADLNGPMGVAVDTASNIYISDSDNSRIRKVTISTGIITTVAGMGGYWGDGGPATSASLGGPGEFRSMGVAIDGAGNIYIADSDNKRIRKVTASTGIITIVAGNGTYGNSVNDGLATSTGLSAVGVAVDGGGNIYIADFSFSLIRKVTASTGIITTVAGNGTYGYSGDGGPATSAGLYYPEGLAVDKAGDIYIADSNSNRVRKVTASTGIITTVAGNGTYGYSGDGGLSTSAGFSSPNGVAVDGAGNIYISDSNNNRIRKVTASTGIITTVAGNGTYGYSGDGGPATSASLNYPNGVTVDGAGNIYIADYNNSRIRKVTASTGIITTVAGNGTYCYSGDGGPATSTSIDPRGVAVDGAGNIYIADYNNSRIRKVTVQPVNLTILKDGAGSGTVTADLGTINWTGNSGTATYIRGTRLNLTATPDTGSTFTGWSGDCLGTGECTLTMDSPKNVTAVFYSPKKWSYITGNSVYSSPAIGSDGTVYVGSADNKIYAINSDGSLKWSYITGNPVESSTCIGSDGTVYVGSDDGKIYAINSDGSLKWSYTTGDWVVSSPAIGSDGTIYVGSWGGKLYAINSDGNLKWSYTTGNSVKSSPAIGSDGTVYVGSDDGKLYAINSSGNLKWSYTTGGYSSPSIGSDDTVYVGSDNKIYAIKSDGSLKWSYTTGGAVESSPAIGSDGTVYVGSFDNKIYAIKSDGSLKWSYTTGGAVESSPAIGSDGTVYVGSFDNKLYAINSDGSLKWSYLTGNLVSSSPVIGSDGTVYVGSWDGKLYAFGGTSGLADSPWPMFRHDVRHSGNYSSQSGPVVLTVAKAGTGSGTVTSAPVGIDCGPACSGSFNAGTNITLVAATTGNQCFTGWSGACTGFASTCMLKIDTDTNVTASFGPCEVHVSKTGTGSGTVTSDPSGIDCGPSCTGSFNSGSGITLVAATYAPSIFTGWKGDCSGAGSCNLTMHSVKNVTAVFDVANKWIYTTGSPVTSSPAIGSDGTIYIGSWDNKLYAIKSDGSLKWSYTTGGEIDSSPTIGNDGTVYVGSNDNKLYAINSNGSLKWSYTTGSWVTSSPAIGNDGTIYVGSDDGTLYAVNSDGFLKWSFTTGGQLYLSPVIGRDGTIYIGSEGRLYAINIDGSLKWNYTTGSAVSSSAAIGRDGTVYVGSWDGKLYAINIDGSLKWNYTTGDSVSSSPAIDSDGTIYVGSYDRKLYAINSDGSLKWSYTTEDQIYSSPAVGSDGTIYVGSYDTNLYAINNNGSLKWNYTTGSWIASSPAIGSDGTVYVGSYNNNLYAFGGTFGLADTSWPMFRHDVLHTGVSSSQSVSLVLTVAKTGTGSGTIGGGGTYDSGSSHDITATASTGSTFTGWSGDCTSTASPLTVLVDKAKTCTATFTLIQVNQSTLTVNTSGTGSGTVTGGGIYDYGTSHNITATASAGSTFIGWSGDCSGMASPVTVLVDKTKTCTATFTLLQYALTINKSGNGGGNVTGSGTYGYATSHDITATASAGSTFTGWSGDCTGTTSPLTVLVDKAKTCIATFTLRQNINISLAAGWNLFGWVGDVGYCTGTAPVLTDYYGSEVNFTQVADLGNAMTAVELTGESYVVVIGPGGQVYVPGSPFNTLTVLMPGMAYWVYMNKDTTIILPGAILSSGSSIATPEGWIQIAYLGDDGATPSSAFACMSGSYDVIVNGAGQVYVPGSPFNTLTNLNQFEGYFIHATGAGTLKFSCQ